MHSAHTYTTPSLRHERHAGQPPHTSASTCRARRSHTVAAASAAHGARPSEARVSILSTSDARVQLLRIVDGGFGLDDDRVHSPNEKFELECFALGARAHAMLIDELASGG